MSEHENLRKWVNALRSGEYAQTRGSLRKAGKFCCLGVACDISGVGEWGEGGDGGTYVTATEAETGVLPVEVADWLGVAASDPTLIDRAGASREPATAFNDQHGYDFAAIADAIERTYLQ